MSILTNRNSLIASNPARSANLSEAPLNLLGEKPPSKRQVAGSNPAGVASFLTEAVGRSDKFGTDRALGLRRDWLFITCQQHGHDWVQDGGRPCPMVDQSTPCPARNLFCGNPGMPSQPVFRCTRCPAIDYGERGGPGWRHCQDHCMPGAS